MDVDYINTQLARMAEQQGQDVQSIMSRGDLNNPAQGLKAQFALQQYNVFVGFQSAVMKNMKDMVMGIISKI